jgi:hypothetical protein
MDIQDIQGVVQSRVPAGWLRAQQLAITACRLASMKPQGGILYWTFYRIVVLDQPGHGLTLLSGPVGASHNTFDGGRKKGYAHLLLVVVAWTTRRPRKVPFFASSSTMTIPSRVAC